MSEGLMYQSPQEPGYWTDKHVFKRDIQLKNGQRLEAVVPIGVKTENNSLVMVLSTFEGNITEPIDNLPGLKIVKGNSQNHLYESDEELLIEFTYYKLDKLEAKPRRIRPTRLMFGIYGDTEKESVDKGVHRALGESADYYLEGIDTQYNPVEDKLKGLRRFPFWRIGLW